MSHSQHVAVLGLEPRYFVLSPQWYLVLSVVLYINGLIL